eukprot:176208-Chlamydomonas_euryale.AAC.1
MIPRQRVWEGGGQQVAKDGRECALNQTGFFSHTGVAAEGARQAAAHRREIDQPCASLAAHHAAVQCHQAAECVEQEALW